MHQKLSYNFKIFLNSESFICLPADCRKAHKHQVYGPNFWHNEGGYRPKHRPVVLKQIYPLCHVAFHPSKFHHVYGILRHIICLLVHTINVNTNSHVLKFNKLSTSIHVRFYRTRCFGCILSLQLSYRVIVLLTGNYKQAKLLINAYTKQTTMDRNFN